MTDMNSRVRGALRRGWSQDAGLGLILVIGVSVFIFAIAATAVSIAVNAMSQSRERTSFEASLAVAEIGVDRTLSEVQSAYTAANADYPVPGPSSSWCSGSAISFPSAGEGAGGVFSTEEAERTWARSILEPLAAAGTCVQTDEHGQYVVLKPVSDNVKYGKVYSLSAIPSFAATDARTRLVKAEYIFMPYRPLHAILTAGPLSISSSTTVRAAYGVDPSVASVHSNSTITGTGNPSVSGPVTSSEPSTFSSNNFASNPGHTVGQLGIQAIPSVGALQFYMAAAGNDPAAVLDWYDLCSGGVVRPYSAAGPCTSATDFGTATSSTQVRGWKYDATSHTWTVTSNGMDGTYYADQANVEVGTGNATFPRMTIVASALNPTDCANKRYGNIDWDHYNLGQPAYHNLWMFADTDLVTHSNWQAGSFGPPVVSGTFVAGDQIELETSSAGAVGSVLAANDCATPPSAGRITSSEIKNPSVYFDPNSDSPFSSVITTSLWLDYTGS